MPRRRHNLQRKRGRGRQWKTILYGQSSLGPGDLGHVTAPLPPQRPQDPLRDVTVLTRFKGGPGCTGNVVWTLRWCQACGRGPRGRWSGNPSHPGACPCLQLKVEAAVERGGARSQRRDECINVFTLLCSPRKKNYDVLKLLTRCL